MPITSSFSASLALFLLAPLVTAAKVDPMPLSQEVAQIIHQQTEPSIPDNRRQLLKQLFKERVENTYNKGAVTALSDAELLSLYSAIYDIVWLTKMEQHSEFLSVIYDAMKERRIHDTQYSLSLFNALIQTRQFAHAKRIYTEDSLSAHTFFPNIEPLQTTYEKNIISGSADNKSFRIAPFTSKAAQLIFIQHPYCRFSEMALNSLTSMSEINTILMNNTVFLSPQEKLDWREFATFQARYPHLTMHTVYKESEWPFITDWSTPSVYFVKNGEVIDVMVGWPKEGNMDSFKRGLMRLGLIK